MKKFMAETYAHSIKPVEVERETDSCIWIKGRRHSKTGYYESYFNTFLEAKKHLLAKAQQKVDVHQWELDQAKKKLAEVSALREVA